VTNRGHHGTRQAWGCLGDAIAGVGVAIAVVTVLAWPLLRLAGVRPAWLVALVALPVAFLVAHAYQAFIGSPAFAMPGTILVPAVSYAAASAWNGRQRADANAASLAATGLPLLAAELPGYRIAQAGAENPGEWITYRLVPDSAPPELTPSVTYDQQVRHFHQLRTRRRRARRRSAEHTRDHRGARGRAPRP